MLEDDDATKLTPDEPKKPAAPHPTHIRSQPISNRLPPLKAPAEIAAKKPSDGLAKKSDAPKPGSGGLPKAKRFPEDSRDGLLRDANTGDQAQGFALGPGLLINDYVLEEVIAAGAMGEVWRGKHPNIG